MKIIYTILINNGKHTYYLANRLAVKAKKISFTNIRGTDHPLLTYYTNSEAKALRRIEKIHKHFDSTAKRIIKLSVEKIYLTDED